jgi:hypothetical protein
MKLFCQVRLLWNVPLCQSIRHGYPVMAVFGILLNEDYLIA